MNPWRHRLRRARFFLGALIAAALIAAAVAVGLLQLLLPLAARYPDRLAALLSDRLHRPVHFDSVRGQWQPSGPLLSVGGLTLGPAFTGGESIHLPKAAIEFDFAAWLKPAHRWVTLRVTGLELRMVHDASGWRVLGIGNPNERQQASLQSLPVDLDLHVLKVSILDAPMQRTYVLFSPHLRVVSVGNTLRFGGTVVREGSPQPLTVIGRFDPDRQDADLYIAGHDLDFADMSRDVDLQGYVMPSGHGDLELWGRWRGNRLQGASARFDLDSLAIGGSGGRHAAISAFSGVIGLNRLADGWELRYRASGPPRDDIDDAGGALLQMHDADASRTLTLAARDLDLTGLLPLAGLLPRASAGLGDWIAAAHPHGQIASAALRWNANGNYAVVAHLHDLGASPHGMIPGADSLDATLRGDQEALALEMPPQAITLRYPAVFRKPFAFTGFGGTFAAWRDGATWHVATDALSFDNDQFGGEGRAEITLPRGGKPFLDAYAIVTHAKVPAATLFWPVNSMPPSAVRWLDRALVSGNVISGRLLIHGDLGDWPFPNHRGRFDALGQVSDAVFNYGDDWPRAEHINAMAEFVDNAMTIDATNVQTLGNTMTHAVANIPDLGGGALVLAVQGNGSGTSLLEFVRDSPVGKDSPQTLSALKIGGTAKLAFTLVMPLPQPQNFTLDGNVQLTGADVVDRAWNLQLGGVSGQLHFDAKGFRADALTANWHGTPGIVSIAIAGDVTDPAHQVEAALTGNFSPQSLLSDYPDLASLANIAHGSALFRIGLNIAKGANAATAPKTLSVQSDLRGVALDLPAPLDKSASTTLPMTLQLGMPFAGADIQLALDDLLRARGRLPNGANRKPAALAIAFGGTPPAVIPVDGMTLGGHTARLDLGGWVQLAVGGNAAAVNARQDTAAAAVGGLPPLTEAQVSADDVLAFGTHLGAMSLRYSTTADAHTITFDGATLAGSLILPSANLAQRGISAQLQRLYWPEPPSNADKSKPAAAPAPDALSGVDPGSLPPLHFSVADLRLGDAKLGATHFESTPLARGMNVSRMDMQSKDVQITSRGDWFGNAQTNRSQFIIDLKSGDFGKMLGAFGYPGLIAGGEHSHAQINASWPGAPTAFSLANLDGTMKVGVGKGRFLEVKPGVGRLFGLLSIGDLPRRLTLDFGDVFKSGFGFNTITGTFTLRDGVATTGDLQIKGPAADIKVRGRTGMRAHDYDQTIDVLPHTSGTLAVVGAVLAGPIGAAAGYALSKGLNGTTGVRYRITGSWEHPVITNLSKYTPRASPQSAPSPSVPLQPTTSASEGQPISASSS